MPNLTERIRTFELNNFNMAIDALQRASRLAAVYDMSGEKERIELQKAIDVEMNLAKSLMDMVRIVPSKSKRR